MNTAENEPKAALRAGRGGDATDRDGLAPDLGAVRATADARGMVDVPERNGPVGDVR